MTGLFAQYSQHSYAVIENLISTVTASNWKIRTKDLSKRRVSVGRGRNIQWDEQGLQRPFFEIDGFPASKDLEALVCSITGIKELDAHRTKAWINRYVASDYVPTHKDAEGDTQLVLCLQELPDNELGGELYINNKRIKLKTGDAVLFSASQLPHGVTPIVGRRVGDYGYSRITLVTRFFRV